MKIVSPDILHRTEAGGVVVGLKTAGEVESAYDRILANARAYKQDATIDGVQVQQMLQGGQEVIIGAVTDQSFGKLVAFGLGGVLVEVLKDITFRLAPTSMADALSMLDGIQAAEILKGVRGSDPVDRESLALLIQRVSELVGDFPEIAEMDLNPVFATSTGAIAADVRIVVDFAAKPPRHRPSAVEIAVFAIPAKFVPQALVEVGEKRIPRAILIPSGFAETGNVDGQEELIGIARKYGIRLMGPNIYGFYYTPKNLCATFCTAYDVKGKAALSSQSGGIGMAILGFNRSAKMGVSEIVGLGHKSDIDEDDLMTFFEMDDNTTIIALHIE